MHVMSCAFLMLAHILWLSKKGVADLYQLQCMCIPVAIKIFLLAT